MRCGKPYQSCLIPYEDEIIALRRRKRPLSCAQIAEHLKEKYQITVRRQTILNFLKVRAKGFKPCKYAWDIKPDNNAQPEAPPIIQTPIPKPLPIAAQPMPATAKDEQPVKFSYKYDPEKSLTRLPPEVAAAMRKKLDEEEEARKVKR